MIFFEHLLRPVEPSATSVLVVSAFGEADDLMYGAEISDARRGINVETDTIPGGDHDVWFVVLSHEQYADPRHRLRLLRWASATRPTHIFFFSRETRQYQHVDNRRHGQAVVALAYECFWRGYLRVMRRLRLLAGRERP
jgi:hypothetical protein